MQVLDRRLNPGGKSLENRQRFLRRAKGAVREAVRQASQARNISDILEGGEVSIPASGVDEPRFHRGSGGIHDSVLPGNKQFIEGDRLPRSGGESGNPSSGDKGGGDSEDMFRFVLTREEFLDLFLDDLELPDLAKKQLAEVEHEGVRRAGYSVSGSPVNIAVTRTMRLALARRMALRRPSPKAIELLEGQIADCDDLDNRLALRSEINLLEAKMRRIPYIDPVDVRYRRFENIPKPAAKAVMFCIMDVSASMSEHMKDMAKRFYMLLYIFLTRRYRNVDIVFIRHTDKAEEVDEQTFFYSPATGGTVVSSAFETMRRIIELRYRPEDWNIYAAQASDGDNSSSDGEVTARLLLDHILPTTQYFAYLEVGDERASGRGAGARSSLWEVYERLCSGVPALSMRKVTSRGEIFPVFRELFQRRPAKEGSVR